MSSKMHLLFPIALAALSTTAVAATSLYTDRAAWEAAVPSFKEVDLDSQVADGATLGSGSGVSLPSGDNLSFDLPLEGRQVPTSFGGWSGGNTPRVLLTESTVTSLIGTFSGSVTAFGLELQPDVQDLFDISLTLADGSVLTQTVDGLGGAAFFGWTAEAAADIRSMVLSIKASAGDEGFALGRLVQGTSASVPDAGSTAALLAMAALGCGVAFSRRSPAVSTR